MYRCDRCLVLHLGATLELVDNAVGHGSALAISASTPAPESCPRGSRRGFKRNVRRVEVSGPMIKQNQETPQFRIQLQLRLSSGAVWLSIGNHRAPWSTRN